MWAKAHPTSAPAEAKADTSSTGIGPKRSVIVPHTGLVARPATAATASSSVENVVENPRTLCRYTTNSDRVSPRPRQAKRVET